METTETVSDTANSFQTFENFEDFSETEENSNDWDDWSKPLKEEEELKDDLKVLKESKTDMEGKVIKEEKEEKEVKKASKKEESKEDEEKVEAKEEGKEEDEEETPQEEKKETKKLRMKMGDDLFNVTSDATFKVKIDGKTEEVNIQELLNNYSGKTAWDRKFTELGREKKELEYTQSQIAKDRDFLLENFNSVVSNLKNPEGNPLDSLLNLVEISGEDPYNAYRRIMEANLDELEKLLDMEPTERELYFLRKKDELQGKVTEKQAIKQKETKELEQVSVYADQLRQTYNVSEEQFIEASDELEDIYKNAGLDENNLTLEVVVDYASLKPHIQEVKQLIAPYEENISEENYGDIVAKLSRDLRDNKISVNQLKNLIDQTYSVDEEVKELNTKVYNSKTSKTAKIEERESSGFETFDDF